MCLFASDSGRILHVHRGCIFMHRLLVEVEIRFATSIRTQSQRKTRNEMRSSWLLQTCRCSFELPERNAIWSRPETVILLENFEQALVRLCKTGCQNKNGIPIGKTLKFVSNSISFSSNLRSKLSTCTCQTHAEPYQINYTETAFYNRKLARYILVAVKHAAKK